MSNFCLSLLRLPPNFFGKAEQGEAATVSRKDSSHDLLHGDNEEEQMEEDSAEELGGQSSSNPPLPTSVQNVGTPGPMQKPVTATLQSGTFLDCHLIIPCSKTLVTIARLTILCKSNG